MDFRTEEMQWRKRKDFKSTNRLIPHGGSRKIYHGTCKSNRWYWWFAIWTTCIRKDQELKDFALNPVHNIWYLARQGLPLRGNRNTVTMSEENSNFHQLLNLRVQENPEIIEWLRKRDDKYTSPEIQNELLEAITLCMMGQISETFFTIMADETTRCF